MNNRINNREKIDEFNRALCRLEIIDVDMFNAFVMDTIDMKFDWDTMCSK